MPLRLPTIVCGHMFFSLTRLKCLHIVNLGVSHRLIQPCFPNILFILILRRLSNGSGTHTQLTREQIVCLFHTK